MWTVIIIGTITVWVAFNEIPPMRKRGLKRELWIFAVLFIIGSGLNIAHYLGSPLKNPLDWIYKAYQPLSDFLFQKLQ